MKHPAVTMAGAMVALLVAMHEQWVAMR